MMVATDSVHGSIFAVVARRMGGQDDCVMQSFQHYKCDQQPSTLDVANTWIKRCQSTILMVTATPKGSKGSGAWRTSEFDDSGTASSISRSRLSDIQDSCWIGSCVDGLDCATLCMGREQFPSDGYRGERLVVLSEARTTLEKWCQLENFFLAETIQEDGAKLNMRWMRGVFVGKLDRTR